PQCAPGQFSCGDGQCLHPQQRCDGRTDCRNGMDEYNCTAPGPGTCELGQTQGCNAPRVCTSEEFKCNDGTCVSISKRCDGKSDCPQSEDEEFCECNEDQVQCEDGRCITGNRCDGIFDCVDGSDEHGCDFCTPDQFPCIEGGCIEEHLRCDGTVHCSDGSDEQNC
ncbi:Ldl recept a domain containing protein, partial [Asbolus verrucosus]